MIMRRACPGGGGAALLRDASLCGLDPGRMQRVSRCQLSLCRWIYTWGGSGSGAGYSAGLVPFCGNKRCCCGLMVLRLDRTGTQRSPGPSCVHEDTERWVCFPAGNPASLCARAFTHGVGICVIWGLVCACAWLTALIESCQSRVCRRALQQLCLCILTLCARGRCGTCGTCGAGDVGVCAAHADGDRGEGAGIGAWIWERDCLSFPVWAEPSLVVFWFQFSELSGEV